MGSQFYERERALDERVSRLLQKLAYLGGYWTVGQARRMGLAKSTTRTLALLKRLERVGLLRRAADYPVVYQVTKPVTDLVGYDLRARRRHVVETVRARLLAVSFYLDARGWPATFVFRPEQRVAAFQDYGYPAAFVPPLWGKPFLSRAYVLKQQAPKLCVALIDQSHKSVFGQAWKFVNKFLSCLEYDPARLELVIAVGSEKRFDDYRRLARNRIQRLGGYRFEIPLKPYRVQTPVPWVRALRPTEKQVLPEPDLWSHRSPQSPNHRTN